MVISYHVTKKENLSSIIDKGLIPSIGKRSTMISESTPSVYLFKNIVDMQDAISNWLGECFEDKDELIILTVNIKNLPTVAGADYEILIQTTINPDRIISILDENLNIIK